MSTKKKVAIFQYDLSAGGIQKSLINLLNKLDYDIYDIDLFLVKTKSFYNKPIPKAVNIIKINDLPKITKLLPILITQSFYKSRLINNKYYDIAIDYNGYQPVTALSALLTKAKSHVLWVHGNISARRKTDSKFRLSYLLQQKKYGLFDRLVTVSEGTKLAIQSIVPKDQKIDVINNIIDTDEIAHLANEHPITLDSGKYNLVALGRLVEAKGYDIMLDKFDKAAKVRQDMHLYIIGDGELRKDIERDIARLKLQGGVTLLGSQSNPYGYLNAMNGLISTSRHEGQGMNILEAYALGLDIFIPKHLEAFTYRTKGYDNIAEALKKATFKKKSRNDLTEYNKNILDSFYHLGK